MRLFSLLLAAVLCAAPAFAQDAKELTTKEVAAALKPVTAAGGGYGIHVTNNREGFQIAFFGTFSVTDDGTTLTLSKSYDQDRNALTPLDPVAEVFKVSSASYATEVGKKDGVVLILTLKWQPEDENTAAVFLRLAVFDTGRLIGVATTEAGSQFTAVGAPTTEADYVGTFLKQAQQLHDTILADADNSTTYFVEWAQGKPLAPPPPPSVVQ
jgi:hypothetical protein